MKSWFSNWGLGRLFSQTISNHSLQRDTNWSGWDDNQPFQWPLAGKPVLSTALVLCHLPTKTTSRLFPDFLNTEKIDSLSQMALKSTIITDRQYSLFRLVRRSRVFHLRKVDIENVVGLAPTAWTFTTASTCPGTVWWTPTICVHANEVSLSWYWKVSTIWSLSFQENPFFVSRLSCMIKRVPRKPNHSLDLFRHMLRASLKLFRSWFNYKIIDCSAI